MQKTGNNTSTELGLCHRKASHPITLQDWQEKKIWLSLTDYLSHWLSLTLTISHIDYLSHWLSLTLTISHIDYLSLLNRPEPVIIMGDLNASHRIFRYNDNNPIGRNLTTLIDTNKYRHVGPDFPKLLRHNSTTSPDILLTNNRVFQNIDISRTLPMTQSFHIPMIATITFNPIQIKIKPRHQFNWVDWTNYRNSMTYIKLLKTGIQDLKTLTNTAGNHRRQP